MFLSATTVARPSFNFAGFPLFLRPKIHGMARSVVSRCRERDYASARGRQMRVGALCGVEVHHGAGTASRKGQWRGSGEGVAREWRTGAHTVETSG